MIPATADELKIIYPHSYTLFQRSSDTQGYIRIRGTFLAKKHPEKLEVRFAGGKWQSLKFKTDASRNTFFGMVTVPVGQGLLEVRDVNNPALTASVACVGVGDLFLITGQSNADGHGKEMVKLNSSNPYVGVKYRRGVWSKGDDPSSNDMDAASAWPIVLNHLIPSQKVPMGFIAAASGSKVVVQWRKIKVPPAAKSWVPGDMYARALEMVKVATDGSMKIRAVLYHQGENDLTHWNHLSVLGDYKAYKTNLTAAVNDFWNDYHAPVLVGQITYETDRLKCDNIRRAQQEIWRENPHALPGAITYDICEPTGWTGHYTTAAEMRAYAGRWTAAILAGVYKQKNMNYPKLLSLRRAGKKQIVFTYDQPMELSSWNGGKDTKAEGFRFTAGKKIFTDAQVVSTEIKGRDIIVSLDHEIPDGLLVYYGCGPDGQGKVIMRSAETNLPAPILFGLEPFAAGCFSR